MLQVQQLHGFGVLDEGTGNDQFTKILLHCNGSDGSTTFTDSNAGGSAHTWTANGNAQIDTAISKFGGAAGLFDGTGDWIEAADSADFTLGTSDFTADCWFNIGGGNGTSRFLFGQNDSTPTITTRTAELTFPATNILSGRVYMSGVQKKIDGTTTITTAGWHHAALVRVRSTLKLFLDGTQEGGDLAIGTGAIQDSANKFSVGRAGELAGQSWFGSIDEFRLSVGIARWTSNFTPPQNPYW